MKKKAKAVHDIAAAADIEDIILSDIDGVSSFLGSSSTMELPTGSKGKAKLKKLFRQVGKTYHEGKRARALIDSLDKGEYNAQEAYEVFDAQLRVSKASSPEIVLTSGESYSNIFHSKGGSEAYSVMANSLRMVYGSDVLIATGNSFTGTVLQADYTEEMVGCMIMPNNLLSFHRDMTGAELKQTIRAYVEGIDGGFKPFNRGSLPIVSGITIEVEENKGTYTLTKVKKDGREIADDAIFSVTCLATYEHFAPFLADESRVFTQCEETVKIDWTNAVKSGSVVLAQPEYYITLK